MLGLELSDAAIVAAQAILGQWLRSSLRESRLTRLTY
jgi:hypothetical protein